MSLHFESDCILITDLPRECVEDCSAPGVDASPAVKHWRETLEFTVDRQFAVEGLLHYGAWEREELESEDDETLAEKVLWLACGDFAEYIFECEEAGVDPYGDRPDGFEPSCGSDIFTMEG